MREWFPTELELPGDLPQSPSPRDTLARTGIKVYVACVCPPPYDSKSAWSWTFLAAAPAAATSGVDDDDEVDSDEAAEKAAAASFDAVYRSCFVVRKAWTSRSVGYATASFRTEPSEVCSLAVLAATASAESPTLGVSTKTSSYADAVERCRRRLLDDVVASTTRASSSRGALKTHSKMARERSMCQSVVTTQTRRHSRRSACAIRAKNALPIVS
mmetsp:Transcript_1798/g.6947  ORF Transcript_1798/g.6947 Transcript_1798/m.6947 type:complete len:215 (-) Transcript_1798:535-1179(-)